MIDKMIVLNKFKENSLDIELEEWDEDQYSEGIADLDEDGEPYPLEYVILIDENTEILANENGCFVNGDLYYQNIYDLEKILIKNDIYFNKIFENNNLVKITIIAN